MRTRNDSTGAVERKLTGDREGKTEIPGDKTAVRSEFIPLAAFPLVYDVVAYMPQYRIPLV
jgi:hypothetical protein